MEDNRMAIQVKDSLFLLKLKSNTYAFRVNSRKQLEHIYWGKSITRIEDFLTEEEADPRYFEREVSAFGDMRYLETGIKVRYSDGVRDFRYAVAGWDVREDTLSVTLQDIHYPFTVTLYYRVHEEFDILERWQTAENLGTEPIVLERFYSAEFALPGNGYRSINYSGNWGAEFRTVDEPVDSGKKVYESLEGVTGRVENPTFILHRNAAEESGEVYFGALAYSGSFQVAVQTVPDRSVHVLLGISDADFEWTLHDGESFVSPKVYAGYTNEGLACMSGRMARFAREALLPDEMAKKPLPVLYNSWYATEFHVEAASQIALAKKAAAIGVELFVIDDGWFGKRNSDRAGLGDWWANPEKFPNGLNELITAVNGLGMQFGIWIEPEMVNPDSDMYRAHPDWVYRYPTREVMTRRNQYMLDMTNPEVIAYLTGLFDKLLSENNIAYVKWDYNRAMGECASSHNPPGSKEIWVRNVQGFYQLAETLRANHPNVEFEACAGGGGRVDFGCLTRFDEYWPSDNTDGIDRLFIQEGYSLLYPVKCMRAWVTHEGNLPIAFRADSSMCGAMGIGLDLTKSTLEELEQLKEKITQYKRIRDTVQFGDVYRLQSLRLHDPIQAVQYEKGGRAVLFAFLVHTAFYRSQYNVRLKGLAAEELYKYRLSGSEHVKSGAYLMSRGLDLPLRRNFDSLIVELEKLS
jgi:alpha-galactosidase